MNKSTLLINNIFEVLNQSQIVYDSSKGLKLIRYGGRDRFAPASGTHYNKPPVSHGTWASIFPYNQLIPSPQAHDSDLHTDLTDQSSEQKNLYHSNTGTGLLKPVYFYWKYGVYSHIDKSGNYQNQGWTFYPNTQELVRVIQNNQSRINMSVDQTLAKSQNVNYPDSTTRYFKAHEYEVFVPSENVKGN